MILIVKNISNFLTNISFDTWIQVLGTIGGATLGAFLGGTYATKISREQFSRQLFKDQLEGMRKKEAMYLLLCNNVVDIVLETFRKVEQINNGTGGRSNIDDECVNLKYGIERLKKLEDRGYIDYKHFNSYVELIRILNSVEKLIEEYRENLISNNTALEEFMDKIEELQKIQNEIVTDIDKDVNKLFNS